MKYLNPVTPSSRATILVNTTDLSNCKPKKKLTFGKISTGGRNSYGRITVRHRGGGHKKKYRI